MEEGVEEEEEEEEKEEEEEAAEEERLGRGEELEICVTSGWDVVAGGKFVKW